MSGPRSPGPIGAALLALALACGPEATTRENAQTGPAGPPEVAPPSLPIPTVADACRGRGTVGDEELEAVPPDARLVAAIDLRADDLDDALDRLEAWTRDEGARVPVVVGLTLSQIGFQTRWIRDLLGRRGIGLESALLLIAPGGESIWLWRIACDLGPLQRALEADGSLRIRALASGGVIAEPRDPSAFPFDLVLTAGDRMGLVPAGRGVDLLRWLGRKSAAAGPLGDASAEAPAALLSALEDAPLRVVIAERSDHGMVITPSGESPSARLRVTGSAVQRVDP
ncbi:MAG: hypothetical protein R3B09_29150 [Nannocystaceae bacterium]